MTLIFILIALGLDYFLAGIERYRTFSGFISLYYSLEKRLAQYKYWDTPLGLLCVLSIPFIALLIIIAALDHWSGSADLGQIHAYPS